MFQPIFRRNGAPAVGAQLNHLVVRTLSALGLVAVFAACSNSGSSGTITPSGVAPDSQTLLVQSTAHSDAAHVEFAYLANAGASNVSAYKIRRSGALTAVAGSPFGAGTDPTGVAVDPTGKFAYVTNYDSESVSAYTINATSGALTAVAGSPFGTGSAPWGIATCRVKAGACISPPL
jgi:6-phosphogluconolactonase